MGLLLSNDWLINFKVLKGGNDVVRPLSKEKPIKVFRGD
jgi:hypothetical protein